MVSWKQIASDRRAQILADSPAEFLIDASKYADSQALVGIPQQILSSEELSVLSLSSCELLAKICKKDLSCKTVVQIYCHAAAVAHQLSNCLTSLLYERAMSRSQYLDEFLAKTGSVVGPLHGLPISIKDSIAVENTDSSLGLVCLSGRKSHSSASLVQNLESLGAIVYCKTAASAATMSCDMESNLFGRTWNPYSKSLIPGSSTGGEASLLTLHGSLVGIGTDLGGSIRFPCSFQGLFGLKPSYGRIPFDGVNSVIPEFEMVPSTPGPMARSFDELELIMQYSAVPAKPWKHISNSSREAQSLRSSQRIAIINDDSLSEEVAKTIKHTVDLLRAHGWKVTDFGCWSLRDRACKKINQLFGAEGSAGISSAISKSGEPWPDRLVPFKSAPSESPKKQELYDLKKELVERKKNLNVDLILSPISSQSSYAWGSEGAGEGIYTCIWNLCDMPTVCFPAKKKNDPSPTGLQLIGERLEEEKVLFCAREIYQMISNDWENQ